VEFLPDSGHAVACGSEARAHLRSYSDAQWDQSLDRHHASAEPEIAVRIGRATGLVSWP
jgi:hypothetical protein